MQHKKSVNISFMFTERELSEEMSSQTDESSDTESDSDSNDKAPVYSRQKSNHKNGKTDNKNNRRGSWWTSIFASFFDKYPVLKSIDGRAASVHNFMRGLSLYKAYPFSPFTSIDSQRKVEDKLEGMRKYHISAFVGTVKFLNFGTPEIFAVIYLKFKQRGQTLRVFR